MGNCNCKDLESHNQVQRETEAYVNKKEIESQCKEFSQKVVGDEYLANVSGRSLKSTEEESVSDKNANNQDSFRKINQNKSVYFVKF